MTTTNFNNITVVNATTSGTINTYTQVFATNENRRAWFLEVDSSAASPVTVAIGTSTSDCVPISKLSAGLSLGDKADLVIKQGIFVKSASASVVFNAYEKNA